MINGPAYRTYLGTLDDVLYRFAPKPHFDGAFIERCLLRHALYGGTVLLNDGFLVVHDHLRAALLGERPSLLPDMIDVGAVEVASIEPSIEGSIRRRAESGVTAHRELLARPEWPALRDVLERISVLRSDRGSAPGWPRKDLTDAFLKIIRRCSGRSAAQLGLIHTADESLSRLLDRFESALEREWSAPRSKWEALASETADESDDPRGSLLELMALAIETHHLGFVSSLCAETGEAMGVETWRTGAFDELFGISDWRFATIERLELLPTLHQDSGTLGAFIRDPAFRSAKQAYLASSSDDDRAAFHEILQDHLGALTVRPEIDVIRIERTGPQASLLVAAGAASSASFALEAHEHESFGTDMELARRLTLSPGLCCLHLEPLTAQANIADVRDFTL